MPVYSLIKAWINKESRKPPEKIAALFNAMLEKLLCDTICSGCYWEAALYIKQ